MFSDIGSVWCSNTQNTATARRRPTLMQWMTCAYAPVESAANDGDKGAYVLRKGNQHPAKFTLLLVRRA